MICDLHHHLVFGVDDGADSFDTSKLMLDRAISQGVTHLVCTSHITPGYRPLDVNGYFRAFDELSQYIQQQRLDIKLYTGSEVMYTEETPRWLAERRILTLNGTWNVLIEFFPNATFDVLRRAALDVTNAGYTPVFAHVERYECLQAIERLIELREVYHVKMQLNANSVLRAFGFRKDRWINKALKDGLIDLVASDAHNVESRPCRIGDAYQLLSKKLGEQIANDFCFVEPANLLK